MTEHITMLSVTAASIGFFHTIFGPDHYLPFIVLSKANRWSFLKTLWITILCGIGHVASSVVLGLTGILFGVALARLEFFEGFRGNIAAWLLILFGLLYCLFQCDYDCDHDRCCDCRIFWPPVFAHAEDGAFCSRHRRRHYLSQRSGDPVFGIVNGELYL